MEKKLEIGLTMTTLAVTAMFAGRVEERGHY
jgi:hypothetical protein